MVWFGSIILLTIKDLQNNRALTCEVCFGFHQVANAKESRLYETA